MFQRPAACATAARPEPAGSALSGTSAALASVRSGVAKPSDGTEGARAAVDLESGSMLVITGDAVARWFHRVPKTTRCVGPRVNLTFRHMVAE